MLTQESRCGFLQKLPRKGATCVKEATVQDRGGDTGKACGLDRFKRGTSRPKKGCTIYVSGEGRKSSRDGGEGTIPASK